MVSLNSVGRGLAALVVAALLAACGGDRNYYSEAGPAPRETAGQTIPEVIRLINAQRVKRGLRPLTVDQRLNKAAQYHADYMLAKDCYAHVCPSGPELRERLDKFRFSGGYAGENIAAGYATPREAAVGWMNSKGHRENILNPKFTHVGAGFVFDPRDGGKVRWGRYWAMNFGVPVDGYADSTSRAAGPVDGGDPVGELIARINERREKRGLNPLRIDEGMNQAARQHAEQIGKGSCPKNNCLVALTLFERLRKAGYRPRSASVQLLLGLLPPDEVAEKWTAERNDPLLSAEFTDLGVGYYYDPNDNSENSYRLYWVAYVAKPAS